MLTKSPKETAKYAATLLTRGVRMFALQGELGSGKTTFVQGLGKALGVREHLASPTFIIMNAHKAHSRRYPYTHLYHVDAYRLHHNKEADILHLREILKNPRYVVAIEWAEKLRRFIPKGAQWLRFSHHKDPKKRTIKKGNMIH